MHIEFYNYDEGYGFEAWEDYSGEIPQVGDQVYITLDDGSESIWEVKKRLIYHYRGIELYCSFIKETKKSITQ